MDTSDHCLFILTEVAAKHCACRKRRERYSEQDGRRGRQEASAGKSKLSHHCRTGNKSFPDSMADLYHSRLDSKRMESLSEFFRVLFSFQCGTRQKLNSEEVK